MYCPVCKQLMDYIETVDGGDEEKQIWACKGVTQDMI